VKQKPAVNPASLGIIRPQQAGPSQCRICHHDNLTYAAPSQIAITLTPSIVYKQECRTQNRRKQLGAFGPILLPQIQPAKRP
jgi:hypothetical protein